MTVPAAPLLSFVNVSKSYSRNLVLSIEHLEVAPGARIVLTGSNGSGKSTLLRILGGISVIDTGTIDRAASPQSPRIGYLPQAGGLHGDFTVADNLRWYRRLFGQPIDQENDHHTAAALGLTPYLTRRFSDLSGGYQRLAAMAAVLDGDPQWLLLDEPFAGMDDDKKESVASLLSEMVSQLELLVIATPVGLSLPFVVETHRLKAGRLQ